MQKIYRVVLLREKKEKEKLTCHVVAPRTWSILRKAFGGGKVLQKWAKLR